MRFSTEKVCIIYLLYKHTQIFQDISDSKSVFSLAENATRIHLKKSALIMDKLYNYKNVFLSIFSYSR